MGVREKGMLTHISHDSSQVIETNPQATYRRLLNVPIRQYYFAEWNMTVLILREFCNSLTVSAFINTEAYLVC